MNFWLASNCTASLLTRMARLFGTWSELEPGVWTWKLGNVGPQISDITRLEADASGMLGT